MSIRKYESPFVTHTGLTCRMTTDSEGIWRVTLEGDSSIKQVYYGANFGKATAAYRDLVDHYRRRAEEEKE